MLHFICTTDIMTAHSWHDELPLNALGVHIQRYSPSASIAAQLRCLAPCWGSLARLNQGRPLLA
jgi:hypothetical protein